MEHFHIKALQGLAVPVHAVVCFQPCIASSMQRPNAQGIPERALTRRRRARHLVVLDEVLARKRHELVVGGMVHHLVADHVFGRQRPVLVHEVPEVSQPDMAAHYQHLSDAIQRITDLAEELMFGAHTTAMLTRELQVLVHLALHHLFGRELQNHRRLMVDDSDGVKQAHGQSVGSWP